MPNQETALRTQQEIEMENVLKTNTPAFPATMTLRDWFAGQVLVGLIAHSGKISSPQDRAEYAYKQADAMISVRVATGV